MSEGIRSRFALAAVRAYAAPARTPYPEYAEGLSDAPWIDLGEPIGDITWSDVRISQMITTDQGGSQPAGTGVEKAVINVRFPQDIDYLLRDSQRSRGRNAVAFLIPRRDDQTYLLGLHDAWITTLYGGNARIEFRLYPQNPSNSFVMSPIPRRAEP